MIDSHCHLDHEPLLSDLNNVLKRSKDVGIKKLLTISTSFESFSRVKEIVNKVGISIIGQTDEICPADKKIYALRDRTNTITSFPLMREFYFYHCLMTLHLE